MNPKRAKINVYYSEQSAQLKEHLLEGMIRHSTRWPDARAFVLVPERQKVDLERAFLEREDAGGLMMAEILSFSRLAQRIFAEAGGAEARTISRAGKSILVQSLLLKDADKFRRFRHLADRPAFAAEMVEVMGDFYRYDISPEELREAAAAEEESSERQSSCDKLADFASLKELLESALQQLDLLDRDLDIDRASRIIENPTAYPRLDFLSESDVFVYGFGSERSLTVQEKRILHALSERVRNINIFVQSSNPFDRSELAFEIGRKSLLDIRGDYPDARFMEVKAEQGVPTAGIKMVLADSPRDELQYVAGDIRALVLEEGYRRRDIAVALCESEDTAAELDAIFSEYGIAAYLDTGRKLMQSSCLRAFSQLLRLTVDDFAFSDLMQYLRSGLTGLSDKEIDYFENSCLSAGLDNSRALKRLSEKVPESSYYEELSGDPEIRTAVGQVSAHLNEIFGFAAQMRQRRTAAAKLEQLTGLLTGEQKIFCSQSFKERIEEEKAVLLEKGHEDEALNLVAAWNALTELTNEARRILAKERMSQKHFVQLILAGISGLQQSSIPVGIDRVRVGTLAQILDYPAKVVYLLGADIEHFPLKGPGEGFLRDDERAFLSQYTKNSLPNRLDNLSVTQALVNYRLQTQAEKLCISAPTKSDDELSIQLQTWKKDPGTQLLILQNDGKADARWLIEKYARRALKQSKFKLPVWQRALQELEASRQDSKELKHESSIILRQQAADFIFDSPGYDILRPGRLSISALQLYNNCPFRYFVNYGVKLRERDIASDNPRDQGSFLHRLMELALLDLQNMLRSKEPDQERLIIEDWHKGLSPDYLRKYYAQISRESGFHFYKRAEQSAMIGERLLRYAATTLRFSTARMAEDHFFPYAMEWGFPRKDDKTAFALNVDQEAVVLRGLIDRIDLDKSGNHFRIYDYKRSSRSSKKSLVGLFDGTDIQLPIYRKVWQEAYPGMKADASLLLTFEGKSENNRKQLHHTYRAEELYKKQLKETIDGQKTELLEKESAYALMKAEDSIRSIRKGYFPAKPLDRAENDGGSPCRFCEYRGLCYYDAAGRPAAPPKLDKKTLEAKIEERLALGTTDA